jgi:uncharacterized membrane protein
MPPVPSSTAAEPIGETHTPRLNIRRIRLADIGECLTAGLADFLAAPTQLLFLGVIYPIVGLLAARAAWGGPLMPLLWPMVAGLSLLGPVVALGLYEISRRRERGLPVSWHNAFDVLRSPAIGSIAVLAVLLLAIFVAWLGAARLIYDATIGAAALPPPMTAAELVERVVGTPEGWWLLLLGNGIGFLFAVVVLCLTVVSFPLLLDRPDVGPWTAVATSLRAVAANPVPMAVWGLIVAALLFAGALPFFVGLAVVMPLLGHATWHLYRAVVER